MLLAVICLTPALLTARQITKQEVHSFTPGTSVLAAQVNSNFDVLRDAANDADTRLEDALTRVETLDSEMTIVKTAAATMVRNGPQWPKGAYCISRTPPGTCPSKFTAAEGLYCCKAR